MRQFGVGVGVGGGGGCDGTDERAGEYCLRTDGARMLDHELCDEMGAAPRRESPEESAILTDCKYGDLSNVQQRAQASCRDAESVSGRLRTAGPMHVA